MTLENFNKTSLRYLTPENLYEQLRNFTRGMAVTKGRFELLIEHCNLIDIEWNHMDQMHRPSIHNTYEKGIRIALGKEFAVSLTQWKNWPLLITVTDVYVAKGLFYQSLTIAGIIFLHSIISMEEHGDDIKLIDEWYIASHRLFKLLHKPLNKKLYKLNQRLQEEDAQIRHGRFHLRKAGYEFRSDPPDYYSSNVLTANTIYPSFAESFLISTTNVSNEQKLIEIGNLSFIVKKAEDKILLWPGVCPHEGGPLIKGQHCNNKITCPWHGLQFMAVELSSEKSSASRYGFEYILRNGDIWVRQVEDTLSCQRKLASRTEGRLG